MTQIVVLGMHASGTSLVSNILIELGVHMGTDFMGPVKGKPTFEDKDFVRVNAGILAAAGGNWERVPSPESIAGLYVTSQGTAFCQRIEKLAQERDSKYRVWGFKDPRTCLTTIFYPRFLSEARYVRVIRHSADVADSILGRGQSGHSFRGWLGICHEYNKRATMFLDHSNAPRIHVYFEDLTDPKSARDVVQRLASFAVGQHRALLEEAESKRIDKAMGCIQFKGG